MGKKAIPSTLFIALSFLIFLIFSPLASAEIRINEFEQNPPGDDRGNEWVELYSSTQMNLDGWKLVNGDNDTFALNGTIDGYLVITFSSLWLDNSDEKVILIDRTNSTIDDTPLLSDSRNDDNTWNLCASEWKFLNSSRGEENRCGSGSGGGSSGGNTSGNSTGGTGSGSTGGGSTGKKNENETIRVRSNVSTEENSPPGGDPQASFLERPSLMEFGQASIVKARFLADGDYPQLLFFLYSEPKRVVRDFGGEQVTKGKRDASTAASARAYAGEEIEFSLPLKIVENCNKYYPEGEYEISLAGFYFSNQEWKSFEALPSFSLPLSFNEELCSGTEQDLQGKANEKQAQQTGASSQPLLRGKIIKSIGLWILIALTAVALVVIWKKKLM